MSRVIFDVRSPKEYLQGRIPGAVSLPLFSDEERALFGTAYKKEGQQVAIRLGIKIVGPKLDTLLTNALAHVKEGATLYCWRGGMRSGFMRQFLELAGIPCTQYQGGYKAFRRQVLATFEKPYKLKLIGGLTGSGKTELLHRMQGEQIIDLEALACHSGSVFGGLHGREMPTPEQFENELATKLNALDPTRVIWVEDESRLIGRCQIPGPFYEAMKQAPLYLVQTTKEARVARIMQQYGKFSREPLNEAVTKLAKRLGGEVTKKILASGSYEDAIRMLLDYYDKTYEYALAKHMGPILQYPQCARP